MNMTILSWVMHIVSKDRRHGQEIMTAKKLFNTSGKWLYISGLTGGLSSAAAKMDSLRVTVWILLKQNFNEKRGNALLQFLASVVCGAFIRLVCFALFFNREGVILNCHISPHRSAGWRLATALFLKRRNRFHRYVEPAFNKSNEKESSVNEHQDRKTNAHPIQVQKQSVDKWRRVVRSYS